MQSIEKSEKTMFWGRALWRDERTPAFWPRAKERGHDAALGRKAKGCGLDGFSSPEGLVAEAFARGESWPWGLPRGTKAGRRNSPAPFFKGGLIFRQGDFDLYKRHPGGIGPAAKLD
jgi:hypothetical protein